MGVRRWTQLQTREETKLGVTIAVPEGHPVSKSLQARVALYVTCTQPFWMMDQLLVSWSSATTFTWFYCLNVAVSPSFGERVLGAHQR